MKIIDSAELLDPSGCVGSAPPPLSEQVKKILNERNAINLDKMTFFVIRPYQYMIVFEREVEQTTENVKE